MGIVLLGGKVRAPFAVPRKLTHEPGMQSLRNVPLVTNRAEKKSSRIKTLQEQSQSAKDRILVVDDDRQSSALFVDALKEAGFAAEAVTSISQASALLMTGPYLALVFGLDLPARQYPAIIIRDMERHSSSLSFPLGVRRTHRERVAINALEACLKRLKLHAPLAAKSVLSLGNLELVLDRDGSHILIEGLPHNLPPRELAILEVLLRRQGHAVSRASMADYLNKGKAGVSSNAIHVYIHRLRKLLGQLGATAVIETVKGIGYSIKEKR